MNTGLELGRSYIYENTLDAYSETRYAVFMTIGYILDDTLDRNDGVQKAVLTIGEYVRSLGHDVHYIVVDTKRTDIANIHSLGTYFNFRFNGNSVRTPKPLDSKIVKDLYSKIKFDVLHVQMPLSPFFAGKLIKLAPADTRIIGTFHILPYSKLSSVGTKLLSHFIKSELRRFHAVYAVSEPARIFMKSTMGIEGKVLPNPVEVAFFRSHRSQHESSKKHLVFIGRFEQRKGVLRLLTALKTLGAEYCKTIDITLAGDGPLLQEAKALSKESGLTISFPGFISDEEKAALLSTADIAVFPSVSGESFGIVLIEAMAAHAGIVLGGNNPGYSSVLAPWPDTLFDPTDSESFARVLQHFLSDDQHRNTIGKAQASIVSQYDVSVIAKQLIDEAYIP